MNEPHLEPDEIVAYRDGRLSPADEARVQDHLVACRECSGLLLDLEGLADPAFGTDEPWSAADAERVWEGVRTGIAREEAPVIPFPTARRAATPRWLQALAAILVTAVIGLSLQVASLRREVRDLSRPQVNAPVLDLFPEGSERRGEEAPEAVEVPAGARLFTLALNPVRREGYRDYEVEIVTAGGRVVWQAEGLRLNEFGSFTLTLSRQALGAGDFRLHLYGRRDGDGREPVGTYGLRLAE